MTSTNLLFSIINKSTCSFNGFKTLLLELSKWLLNCSSKSMICCFLLLDTGDDKIEEDAEGEDGDEDVIKSLLILPSISFILLLSMLFVLLLLLLLLLEVLWLCTSMLICSSRFEVDESPLIDRCCCSFSIKLSILSIMDCVVWLADFK